MMGETQLALPQRACVCSFECFLLYSAVGTLSSSSGPFSRGWCAPLPGPMGIFPLKAESPAWLLSQMVMMVLIVMKAVTTAVMVMKIVMVVVMAVMKMMIR